MSNRHGHGSCEHIEHLPFIPGFPMVEMCVCTYVCVSLGRDHSFSNWVAQAQPKYGSPDSIEYTGRAHLFSLSSPLTLSLHLSLYILLVIRHHTQTIAPMHW